MATEKATAPSRTGLSKASPELQLLRDTYERVASARLGSDPFPDGLNYVRFKVDVTGAGSIELELSGKPKALNADAASSDEVEAGLAARVAKGDLIEFLIEEELQRLLELKLVSLGAVAPTATLPFDLSKTLEYAQNYCAGGNDCSDSEFPLDCTHFMCHCLAAGGISVSRPSAQCASGLCIRVNDLAAAISNSVGKYSNVKKLAGYAATQKGDICFIPSWFGLSKEHAMLLADTATSTGAKVYAHTNNRCGNLVTFDGAECAYYRIESA